MDPVERQLIDGSGCIYDDWNIQSCLPFFIYSMIGTYERKFLLHELVALNKMRSHIIVDGRCLPRLYHSDILKYLAAFSVLKFYFIWSLHKLSLYFLNCNI